MNDNLIAHFHLPGLFEFFPLYKKFLPLYYEHREYFYSFCDISSIYGSPNDCIFSGGRVENSDYKIEEILSFLNQYNISPRLTFSNSLLTKEDLKDKTCNDICDYLNSNSKNRVGIIISSDLLLNYLKEKYPSFYFISSTTKVIKDFNKAKEEIDRKDFEYVVLDYSLNKDFLELNMLSKEEKEKVEFLVNECCPLSCKKRKECYENVSKLNLNKSVDNFICTSKEAKEGYKFSKAMKNPSFISIDGIKDLYLKFGFNNFKIEGRSLGSALILEFLLYYLTKPEYQINVREEIYLDNTLDLF